MATKTSLENKHLGNGDYIVIIAYSAHPLFDSDEGLALATSAFQIFHGANSTIINFLINQIFMYYWPSLRAVE